MLASFRTLDQSGGIPYIVNDNEGLSPTTIVITDSVEDTVSPDRRQQLFNEQSQQSPADQSQVEVVDHEQCVELERRTALHDFATSKDNDIVGNEHDTGRLDGREGGLAADELELARGIAHDILERLVEDRP